MPNSSYVVAFSGARDAYQVPLALYQTRQLQALVTDVYAPELPSLVENRFPKLAGRRAEGLPFWKARSSLRGTWASQSWRFTPSKRVAQTRDLKRSQDLLSAKAGALAARTGSGLFLYAGYGRVALADPALRSARKIVFMYHPHIQRSAEILTQDAARWPDAAESLAQLEVDKNDRDVDEELRAADLVVCASTFTGATVSAIGVDAAKLRIIPYGIDFSWDVLPRGRDRCRFLFVGSGIHRKGLHVLLTAWKEARLADCHLTLVCRHITPWIRALANIEGVTIESSLSASALHDVYQRSDVFVMPSLVEGFGYVYLEALARGCFCIGTTHTGLPDLGLPATAAEVVEAANVPALTNALVQAHRRWVAKEYEPRRIQQAAARWSWARFRTEVAELASNLRKA